MSQAPVRRLHMGCGESLQRRLTLPAPAGKVHGSPSRLVEPQMPATKTKGKAQ